MVHLAGGFLTSLGDSLPAVLIEQAGHHVDLYWDEPEGGRCPDASGRCPFTPNVNPWGSAPQQGGGSTTTAREGLAMHSAGVMCCTCTGVAAPQGSVANRPEPSPLRADPPGYADARRQIKRRLAGWLAEWPRRGVE